MNMPAGSPSACISIRWCFLKLKGSDFEMAEVWCFNQSAIASAEGCQVLRVPWKGATPMYRLLTWLVLGMIVQLFDDEQLYTLWPCSCSNRLIEMLHQNPVGLLYVNLGAVRQGQGNQSRNH